MASKNTRNSTPTSAKVKYDPFLGTKKEWVVFEFPYPEKNMKNIFSFANGDKVIVAKDEKGLYITGKAYVDAPSLDPFRLYHRKEPIVKEDGSYDI